jgi:hypothetical protein
MLGIFITKTFYDLDINTIRRDCFVFHLPFVGGTVSKKAALADYIEVKDRVAEWRKERPDWGVDTDIIGRGENFEWVMIKAKIYNDEGILKSAGTSREQIQDNVHVNATSIVENCETSAIGRALAFLGYKVTKSIASKEEMRRTIKEPTAYTGTEPQKKTLQRIMRANKIGAEHYKAIHESLTKNNILDGEIDITKHAKEITA